MFKARIVALALIAAGLLCWQVMPASVDMAASGVVDPCSSTASLVNTPPTTAKGTFFAWIPCPLADGATLAALTPPVASGNGPHSGNATIDVHVEDATGTPIPAIPAVDFWAVGCTDNLFLCFGAASMGANAATNATGDTQITGTVAGGGIDSGILVVCQGIVIGGPNCGGACLAIKLRSPDTSSSGFAYVPDGQVEDLDFSTFGASFEPLLGVYDDNTDYNQDGQCEDIDFTLFGAHWKHTCNGILP